MRRILLAVLFVSILLDGVFLYRLLHASSVPMDARDYASGQTSPQSNSASAEGIQRLLTQQASDWNRGDLDAFASGYKHSPDILFIGRKVSRGYDQMLAGYKHGYATREAMGTLTFSQLEVQPLDAQFATATGHYHLDRSPKGGGDADGYFLLVLENTASGWKIVRDDTTSLPATTSPPATPKP